MDIKQHTDYQATQSIIANLEHQLYYIELIQPQDLSGILHTIEGHFTACLRAMHERQQDLINQVICAAEHREALISRTRAQLIACLTGCREILNAGSNVFPVNANIAAHIWKRAITMELPTYDANQFCIVEVELPLGIFEVIRAHADVITTSREMSTKSTSSSISSATVSSLSSSSSLDAVPTLPFVDYENISTNGFTSPPPTTTCTTPADIDLLANSTQKTMIPITEFVRTLATVVGVSATADQLSLKAPIDFLCIGQPGVGKTAFLKAFTEGMLEEENTTDSTRLNCNTVRQKYLAAGRAVDVVMRLWETRNLEDLQSSREVDHLHSEVKKRDIYPQSVFFCTTAKGSNELGVAYLLKYWIKKKVPVFYLITNIYSTSDEHYNSQLEIAKNVISKITSMGPIKASSTFYYIPNMPVFLMGINSKEFYHVKTVYPILNIDAVTQLITKYHKQELPQQPKNTWAWSLHARLGQV